MQPSFEKLGLFYLGKVQDPESNATTPDYVLYDAQDLTTHALCVGMTGSGKTGLCVSLLEEAGIDGIPAIVVDPKGDLGNLLLTFPELRAEDFRPWIDAAEAAGHGQTEDQYAAHVAKLWRDGLAQWGEDGARIRRFRSAVDLAIYTPGSNAGLPLTVLRSFAAPPPALRDDSDAFRQHVAASTAGLMALLGLDADPVRSRDFILVSNVLDHVWRAGESLDLAGLIGQIQTPPFAKVGVLDLDTFYPAKERLQLAMSLNNLLASPAFASWLEGEPLDIQRLLYTARGKPRISIISIAHLADSERMFFLTILLNELLTWVRGQAGTPSLRALFYMDEVFGYFPPTANPPSKVPMLTLLKQARAYGLGIVLATQNPVDLDYKGLSNCGTWFLGRLQTERDKARVLDGLEGASARAGAMFDRQQMDTLLSGLDSRVFLMNNVHEDAPALLHTRWALSYLRGPLARDQIHRLMADHRHTTEADRAGPARDAAPSEAPVTVESIPAPTANIDIASQVPPAVTQRFLATRTRPDESHRLVYRPALLGTARLHFVRVSYQVDDWQDRCLLSPHTANSARSAWETARAVSEDELAWASAAAANAQFADLPPALTVAKNYQTWQRQLIDHLYQTQTLPVWRCAALKQYARPGEPEDAFRIRLSQLAHEQRDLQVEKLRRKYASKLATLKDQIERAKQRVAKEKDEYQQKTLDTVIAVGSSIFGALLGRKLMSRTNVSKASTSARSVGRAARARSDIGRAEEKLETLAQEMKQMQQRTEQEIEKIDAAYQPDQLELETLNVRPRKSDVEVQPITVVWTPWLVDSAGIAQPAY